MWSWGELAAHTLARQFPADATEGDATGLLARVGPIQSQTARSVFLGLAARLPGLTKAHISRAYETYAIVRGSSLRGTVHTSTAALHPLLEVATRLGQQALFARGLRLADATLEQVWAAIEEYATGQWRSSAELGAFVKHWLGRNDPAAQPRMDDVTGRYYAVGHGGLLRRPVKGDWAGQQAPHYRSASALLGDRRAVLDDPDAAVDALLRHHVAASGPSSRYDLAWWSGLGLTRVDASLARLDLPAETGPDGRRYHDLPDAPPPAELPGPRLLPEFDALLCGYDPAGRERFVDPAHYAVLWNMDNGMLLAPLLLDGRLRGHWRLLGTGRRRTLRVTRFPGTRVVTEDELAGPATGMALALGIEIGELELAVSDAR